jgi:hypothetical protein
MVLAERPSRQVENSSEFSYLKYMKGVKEAFEAWVTEEYGTFDLGRLRRASPEVQKRITEEVFEAAGVEYDRLKNSNKQGQLKKVKEAFGEGRLSFDGLMQGLGFWIEENNGKGRGLLDRIKNSLGRTVRT